MHKSDKQAGIHEGHRARVIKSYSNIDLTDLSPHQVIEFILFYVFPRGDVNELAHRLLDRFGSVQNVLEASQHSLMQVYGINERSARMICGFLRIFEYYTSSKMSKKVKITDWAQLYDICESLVRFQSKETLYILALDSQFRFLTKRLLNKGMVYNVSSSSNVICDFINESKAAYIVLTHNHPGGVCTPSQEDVDSTEKVKDVVKVMHSNFLEHCIIGSDGIFSLTHQRKVRSFVNAEDVKKIGKSLKN